MECIRERTERRENELLSDRAAKSAFSKGRVIFESPCDIRTDFQRDRDRIIHCNAFRRLKHKTQVFLSPEGDHYRTRLTHTLEVSQIARTIARALSLNEDLAEAIALGHDLGHTPFGHAGETALGEISGNFKHYEQSVRVCERIEKNGKGLNLTAEVLNGILHHTKGEWADTLEGCIVRLSDRIAYINHDIDDAVRAGVIKEKDIPKRFTDVLGLTKTNRINSMVVSVIDNSDSVIKMGSEIGQASEELHTFMYENVYLSPIAKSEEGKVFGIIKGIYDYYIDHPNHLSVEYCNIAKQDGIQIAIFDNIAGMTDRYAVQTYSNFFIPKSWHIFN